MLRAEKLHLTDSYREVKEITKKLDQTNVKILSAMWKFGPRNLLEVSRRTRIPFTSVYHRVGKLEAKAGSLARLVPQVSRLGMVELVVLVAAKPGMEDKVTAALKVPGYWRTVTACEAPFTHHSVHIVPARFQKEFRAYVQRLAKTRLVALCRIVQTGDYVPNFPNFSYYNATKKEWRFEWNQWLSALRRSKPTKEISDPKDYPMKADKKDILIVKELEKNARSSFADMSPVLGISLQGVKYHYDKKLRPGGIIGHFEYNIVPYPVEIAAYHEVMLEFPNKLTMNRFFSVTGEFFFVLGTMKILHKNALLVRTYVPQSQLQNMFNFFSEMAKAHVLSSYSTIRLNFSGIGGQTVPVELFNEDHGWTFDLRKCLAKLSKLR